MRPCLAEILKVMQKPQVAKSLFYDDSNSVSSRLSWSLTLASTTREVSVVFGVVSSSFQKRLKASESFSKLLKAWARLTRTSFAAYRVIHSDSLTWKWKIAPWKTILLYEQGFLHFHVSESECICIKIRPIRCRMMRTGRMMRPARGCGRKYRFRIQYESRWGKEAGIWFEILSSHLFWNPLL